MKKISAIVVLVCVGIALYHYLTKADDVPIQQNIIPTIIDNGTNEGKHKFIYTLENVGVNDITLVFPTSLEYNVVLKSLDMKALTSGDKVFEHLYSCEESGRRVTVKQAEQIKYPVYVNLNEIPKGRYEIQFTTAANNVSTNLLSSKIFIVE